MKLTSGKRKIERQSRVLDRLLASPKRDSRIDKEIFVLKQRTGRSFEQTETE